MAAPAVAPVLSAPGEDDDVAARPGANGRVALYLPPGRKVEALEPCAVTTILGSCVAVCLTDPQARTGGVNHYLLPYGVGAEHSLRYGSVAIPGLIDRLLSMGCSRDRLEAKVFGGACVTGALAGAGERLGAKNVELALRLLRHADIPVIARDVGGTRGRKVIYQTDDGAAWVRRL